METDKKPGLGVGVILIKDNKVLMGHRHPNAKKAEGAIYGQGTWTMPGGKIEFKEEMKNAAIRELFEETGIKAKTTNLKIFSIHDNIEEDAHFVTIGFLLEKWEGDVKVCEPEKITQWKWFNINDLPKPIYKPSEKIVKEYLKLV